MTLLESNKNAVRDPKKKMKFLTFFDKYTVIVKYRVIYQKREFRGVIYEKERPAGQLYLGVKTFKKRVKLFEFSMKI